MNTSELSLVIGKIKSDYKKQKISETAAKTQLQSIDWNNIVEDTVSKTLLQTVVKATILILNTPKEL